jgi:hypothetical protein
MIAKVAAHFLMEAVISAMYYTESPTDAMMQEVSDSVYQFFHLPHVEVDYDKKDSFLVQSYLKGDGFDYNNT